MTKCQSDRILVNGGRYYLLVMYTATSIITNIIDLMENKQGSARATQRIDATQKNNSKRVIHLANGDFYATSFAPKINYTRLVFIILLASVCRGHTVMAQTLVGMSTHWNDSFVEWTIFTDDEAQEGELKMRWQMQNDWSKWDYRVGDKTGEIQMKWKDDPTNWEVRAENQIIFAHTKWKNDFSEWRIAGPQHVLNLKTRYRNDGNDWLVQDEQLGRFEIFTEYEGDPRDWIIVDKLDTGVGLPLKMAILFLAIYHSSPRQ